MGATARVNSLLLRAKPACAGCSSEPTQVGFAMNSRGFSRRDPPHTTQNSPMFFSVTVAPAGTERVNQTLPPMTAPLPMTVSPPRIVAPG